MCAISGAPADARGAFRIVPLGAKNDAPAGYMSAAPEEGNFWRRAQEFLHSCGHGNPPSDRTDAAAWQIRGMQRGELMAQQLRIDLEHVAQAIEGEDAMMSAQLHPRLHFFKFPSPGRAFCRHAHHVGTDRIFEHGKHQTAFAVDDPAARNEVVILLRHQRKDAIDFGPWTLRCDFSANVS